MEHFPAWFASVIQGVGEVVASHFGMSFLTLAHQQHFPPECIALSSCSSLLLTLLCVAGAMVAREAAIVKENADLKAVLCSFGNMWLSIFLYLSRIDC